MRRVCERSVEKFKVTNFADKFLSCIPTEIRTHQITINAKSLAIAINQKDKKTKIASSLASLGI